MFRSINVATVHRSTRRNFVSPVAEPRKKLVLCGLSPNKADFVTRVRDNDKSHSATRAMSTYSTPTDNGIAPAVTSMASQASEDFFKVVIPDLWQPDAETPVQVPYLPDFWDSSIHKEGHGLEEASPRLLVVAGADTHLSGGPSHTLLDEHAAIESGQQISRLKSQEGGIWDDIADDVGMPRPNELRAAFWRAIS